MPKVNQKILNLKNSQDIAEEVVKTKRTRPDTSELRSIHSSEDDNRRYLSHSRMLANLPEIDNTSLESVKMRTDQYFDICEMNGMKPTVAGYALAFGVDRMTMWRWVTGQNKGIPGSVVTHLKKAYSLINSQMEDYMQNGKINPVAGIFLMKNNMGYTDKTEVVVAPGNVEPESQELLEQAELLPED